MGDHVVIYTNVQVGEIGRRWFRRRAGKLARKSLPDVPSYHLRIEKVGLWTYAVVAYQNVAVGRVTRAQEDDNV